MDIPTEVRIITLYVEGYTEGSANARLPSFYPWKDSDTHNLIKQGTIPPDWISHQIVYKIIDRKDTKYSDVILEWASQENAEVKKSIIIPSQKTIVVYLSLLCILCFVMFISVAMMINLKKQ